MFKEKWKLIGIIILIVIILTIIGLIVAVFVTPKTYKNKEFTPHADEINKIVGGKGLTVYTSKWYPWTWGG